MGLRDENWMHTRIGGEQSEPYRPLGILPPLLCSNHRRSGFEDHDPHEWLTHDHAFVRPDPAALNVVQRVETVTWYWCPGTAAETNPTAAKP